MKRFSTTDLNDGRNSLGIFEILAFIQEGASRHGRKTLRDRTIWQHNGLRALRKPQSPDSLIRYWRFKLVPEAGGLFEVLRYTGKDAPAVIPYRPWRP